MSIREATAIAMTTANPGWYAVYRNDEGTEEYFQPINVWVLFRQEIPFHESFYVDVDGYDLANDSHGEFCQDVGNFDRYVYDPTRDPMKTVEILKKEEEEV